MTKWSPVMPDGGEDPSCRLSLVVQPNARSMAGKGEVAWTDQGELRVRVTAVPERGKANDAVIGLLASRLGVSQREVRIRCRHEFAAQAGGAPAVPRRSCQAVGEHGDVGVEAR